MISPRTSVITSTRVHTVTSSSVFQVGDSSRIQGTSKVYAVLREESLFLGNEGDFKDSVFTRSTPWSQLSHQVEMKQMNMSPYIAVKHINILGIGASSVFHIGSTGRVGLDSRIKNVRHLLSVPSVPPSS
ncbi:spore germination protein GerPE [Aureibacillus halotolerans]|uniref:Spore germination protein PE n=1 Tax=Aureibacillus halotolerans TaxID=1508390 RepID=A0A4R6UBF0_9BACI|nr:spore germination protein GerPE [Aureibacillus halotolerans]TDQ42075.1 spore germination protein PE [Aureibacillus halotolerans]